MKKANGTNFKFLRKAIFKFSPLVFVFGVASCSVHNQMDKDDFAAIRKGFSAHFYDQADSIHYPYSTKPYVRSLIKDFTRRDDVDYTKPVRMSIYKSHLFLNFSDINKKQHVLKFYGKLHKKKFVFYTNYTTITFPVLFMNKDMDKYAVYISGDNEVIFENHNVNEGMLLFFGAGNSTKSNYKFKLLKNE